VHLHVFKISLKSTIDVHKKVGEKMKSARYKLRNNGKLSIK